MELFERILSKPEINSRAVDALNAIVANQLVASKQDLAECLGVSPQKFSEILNFRMKAGIDMVAKICDMYFVDPYWLLLGRGNSIFRKTHTPLEPYFIEDGNNLNRRIQFQKDISINKTEVDADDVKINIFYKKTLEQAEEIGKLKERISQLELQLQKNVSDASTGDIASAG